MEMVWLGRTELRVSRMCYGTWQFGGDWGPVDEGLIRHVGVANFDAAGQGPAPEGR